VPGEELGVAERDAGVENCEARAESRREERAPLLRRRPNLVGSMLVAGAAFWAESRPIADNARPNIAVLLDRLRPLSVSRG
jgi:hypothetical protein